MNSNKIIIGRVYQKWTISSLLRFKLFLFISRFKFIIKNLRFIYSKAGQIIGISNVNLIVEKIFGDIFIGGKNENELLSYLKVVQNKGFLSIANFAPEFLKHENERDIRSTIENFKKSVDTANLVDKNNLIALKISSLIPINITKDINKIQHALLLIEDAYNSNIRKKYDEIFYSINSYGMSDILNINKSNFDQFLERSKSVFDSLPNKSCHFKLNLFELIDNKDTDKVISDLKLIFNIDEGKLTFIVTRIKKLIKDFKEVIDYSHERNSSIMIDAEQTYLQHGFDYLVSYLSLIYNKNDKCILLNTHQMYLKNALCKLKNSFSYYEDNNINRGIKIVRGAYMYEEKFLSNLYKYEDPICLGQEQTNLNYNTSIDLVLKSFKKNDKVIFATHNIDSIAYLGNSIKDPNISKDINNLFVAQLTGIGEHASWLSKDHFVNFLFRN